MQSIIQLSVALARLPATFCSSPRADHVLSPRSQLGVTIASAIERLCQSQSQSQSQMLADPGLCTRLLYYIYARSHGRYIALHLPTYTKNLVHDRREPQESTSIRLRLPTSSHPPTHSLRVQPGKAISNGARPGAVEQSWACGFSSTPACHHSLARCRQPLPHACRVPPRR